MPTIKVGKGSTLELQTIADILGDSRKVVVITGAGISTNCGIPDFRSENGLYSMIQAQYDAALQNPPWEDSNTFDIDDRPIKKRRVSERWYYELVPASDSDGDDHLTSQQPKRSLRSHSSNGATSGECTPATSNCSAYNNVSAARSRSSTSQLPTGEECNENTTLDIVPHSRKSPCEYQQPAEISGSTATSTSDANNLPPSRSRSLRSRLVTANLLADSTSTSNDSNPGCSSMDTVLPLSGPKTLQRADSTALSTKSDFEEPPSTQSSQTSSSRASLPNLKGRDLFDSIVWSDALTTSIFYMFISSLRQKIQNEVTSTTETHKFIRVLRDGGRLVRNYTQNIDSLEAREGLCTKIERGPGSRARFRSKMQRKTKSSGARAAASHNAGVEVVLLHGSLASLRCVLCTKLSSWDEADRQTVMLAGQAPDCPSCTDYNAKREGRGGRTLAVGRLRPDIVLYGEEHPYAHLVAPLITHDMGLHPDILLILGTSLRVHGLKVIVKEFAKAVHLKGGKVVFVNRTKPPESTWGHVIDYWVEWDCDAWVLDLKKRRRDIWLPQGTREEHKKRHSSLGKTKADPKKPWRPQALRDDKLNGVHFTFKILDVLGKLEDSLGERATRTTYSRSSSRMSIASTPGGAMSTSRANTEKLPKKGDVPDVSITSQKRKSRPSCLRDDKRNGAYLVTSIMNKLRSIVPGLSATSPEPLPRIPLTERPANLINYAPPSFKSLSYDTANYLFPRLQGLGWPLKQMNLLTHPPSGSPQLLSPTITQTRSNHSYHAHSPSVTDTSPDTIVVDSRPLLPHPSKTWLPSDTIVVAGFGQIQDDASPTPLVSNPTTPRKQRIKSLGSIGAILSSPSNAEGESVIVFND